MTVDELIEQLAEYPPGLQVVVNGYENGYDDLTPEQRSVVRIVLNAGKHRLEEQHGDTNGLTDSADVVEALVLRRVSN